MNYIFIHYPKCTTCQRAKKFLDENQIKYTERHIVTETPTYEELKAIIEASGLPVSKFFNTSGMLYRSMNLKEELKSSSDDEKIRLLASNGMLIKRPILIKKNKILLGFKEDEWKEIKSK
ncbi:MAG: arsenate reductase family protein [Clostridia bacterium]|nr:arsenate reductase family protein [Clostridia bacterium]